MILKVFSVYDSKAEAYTQPFFLTTKGQAIRSFSDAVDDPQHNFARHPEDFTLFELGEYDDATGQFAMQPTPVSIGKALEFKKS